MVQGSDSIRIMFKYRVSHHKNTLKELHKEAHRSSLKMGTPKEFMTGEHGKWWMGGAQNAGFKWSKRI